MPTSEKKWAPQLVGSKPRHLMNVIDREGLGPFILKTKYEYPSLGSRKISEMIAGKFDVYVGFRSIDFYLATFRDPETGKVISPDRIPNIPDRETGNGMSQTLETIAQTIHQAVEESQMDDVSALEEIGNQGIMWFRDPGIPIPLKLKVSKELREIIKLKLEIAGVVKPQSKEDNKRNMIDMNSLNSILEAKPESIELLRELLYMANKPEIVDITPEKGDSDV